MYCISGFCFCNITEDSPYRHRVQFRFTCFVCPVYTLKELYSLKCNHPSFPCFNKSLFSLIFFKISGRLETVPTSLAMFKLFFSFFWTRTTGSMLRLNAKASAKLNWIQLSLRSWRKPHGFHFCQQRIEKRGNSLHGLTKIGKWQITNLLFGLMDLIVSFRW